MRNEKYGNTCNRNLQNSKCQDSEIYNIDTFRGCPNKCESCYAKRNSAICVEKFEIPVKVEKYIGRLQDAVWYRIGNSGDPAMNWKYSEKIIKTNGFKKFFCVTKLQSVQGFTGYFDKLQVSVDPLNKKHFTKTLENVKILLKEFPLVKIMLRVRSLSTTNADILYLMDTAVKFANTHNLPIIETRMRFNRKEAIQKYSLVKEDYDWRGSTLKPNVGIRFLVGAKKYYDCDLFGMKCANCSNCTLPWTTNQFQKTGEFIAPRKQTLKHTTKEAA